MGLCHSDLEHLPSNYWLTSEYYIVEALGISGYRVGPFKLDIPPRVSMEGNARAAPLHSTEQNIYCSHLFKSTLALPPQLALFELWGLLQSDWLEIVTLQQEPVKTHCTVTIKMFCTCLTILYCIQEAN